MNLSADTDFVPDHDFMAEEWRNARDADPGPDERPDPADVRDEDDDRCTECGAQLDLHGHFHGCGNAGRYDDEPPTVTACFTCFGKGYVGNRQMCPICEGDGASL